MSLLGIIQLTGYTLGAWLHLWLAWLLFKGRSELTAIERVLLALAVCIGAWHGSNLLSALHALLGLDARRWHLLTSGAETIAVVNITVAYSLLLHVHLHLWAQARNRVLTLTERWRVWLSYVPLAFLVFAVPRVWAGTNDSMLEKLTAVDVLGWKFNFVVAFACWAAYVLAVIATTDLFIARNAKTPLAATGAMDERRFMRTLAGSFLAIALLLLLVHVAGVGSGTLVGAYLQTLANLGSLLPTALLAYYIYRYRYLELIIKNSLVVATFAVVVMLVYLYGIRAFGEFLTSRYGLRSGAIESLLILALVLAAAPLRAWLEKHFQQLFGLETRLYRDVVARLNARMWQYKQLPQLLRFVEERTTTALALRRVRFVLCELFENDDVLRGRLSDDINDAARSDARQIEIGDDKFEVGDDEGLLALFAEASPRASVIEDDATIRARGFALAYPLRREDQLLGVMLVDAGRERLTPDVRSALEVLAGQVALAIEDCRLVEENVRLERRLAHGERLAALGQVAATVAHEIKNPLSAIKSIAQVMREDDNLTQEYGRDLDLIVGETDRLSRSVTQLLDWKRHGNSDATGGAPCRINELARHVVELFRLEAERRGVTLRCEAHADIELDHARASAMRDCLSNLTLNALQATPAGKGVLIRVEFENHVLTTSVTDGGAGIPHELRRRIWEPFFTTKQRGTGLGLAIVRKRIEEIGGSVHLVSPSDNAVDGRAAPADVGKFGARFELRLPLERAEPRQHENSDTMVVAHTPTVSARRDRL